MQIQITEKIIIPEKELVRIKEEYTECDKCRTRIPDTSYNGSPFYGEIKLPTGHKTIELCKECTKKLVVLLIANDYRLVETDF